MRGLCTEEGHPFGVDAFERAIVIWLALSNRMFTVCVYLHQWNCFYFSKDLGSGSQYLFENDWQTKTIGTIQYIKKNILNQKIHWG